MQHVDLTPDVLSGAVDFSFPAGTIDGFSRSAAYPHLAIAADSQIHNRDDLREALGLTGPGWASLDDRGLLFCAWDKWEEDCPRFLLGEFAFAIWDDRKRRLFCCRDQIGFRAFLYWHSGSHFVFAAHPDHLFSHPAVPRELNRRKLAALSVPRAHHRLHQETFHAGVLSLPPGVSMIVEPDRLRQRRYWELQPGKTPACRPGESFEALREILFRAVECRLPEHSTVTFLSGGLDSSAVTAIAARCLQKRNRELTAISAILPEEHRCARLDERDYIDEFRSWSNVTIRYVTAPDSGPFECLSLPARLAASPLRAHNYYLYEECEKAALACGAKTVIGGEGGELGFTSWGHGYYLQLAFGLRWLTLYKELKALPAVRGISPIRMMKNELRDVFSPVHGQKPYVFLARNFVSEPVKRNRWKLRWPHQRRYQAALIRDWLSRHAARGQTGLIRHSYPLLDKRVLEFCLALPPDLNVNGGYQRCLARRALDGILPRRIQWRTGKIPFAPDYYVRFNAQLGMAKDFVSSVRANDPVRTVVDVDRLCSLLQPVDPIAGSLEARDQVPCTLYLIAFLRQFSEFRP